MIILSHNSYNINYTKLYNKLFTVKKGDSRLKKVIYFTKEFSLNISFFILYEIYSVI